jgi:hypothetical protein
MALLNNVASKIRRFVIAVLRQKKTAKTARNSRRFPSFRQRKVPRYMGKLLTDLKLRQLSFTFGTTRKPYWR